jgi:hypothetical protein
VFVVVELLQPERAQLSAEAQRRRYTDYTHVNKVIARTVDVVQDEIVARATPALKAVDVLFGPLDEWVAERVIVDWRETVWQHAVALLEAPMQRLTNVSAWQWKELRCSARSRCSVASAPE